MASLSQKYELPTKKEEGIMHHFNVDSRKKNQNTLRDFQIYEHDKWLKYCLNDTQVTLELYRKLKEKLENPGSWNLGKSNMWEFYQSYYRGFGVCLANMQWRGVYLDPKLLEEPRKQGTSDKRLHRSRLIGYQKLNRSQ